MPTSAIAPGWAGPVGRECRDAKECPAALSCPHRAAGDRVGDEVAAAAIRRADSVRDSGAEGAKTSVGDRYGNSGNCLRAVVLRLTQNRIVPTIATSAAIRIASSDFGRITIT